MRCLLAILFSFIFGFSSYSQYYDSTELSNIGLSKSAAEGDFYLDTLRGEFYMGLSTGGLVQINGDSSVWRLEGNDTVSANQFLGTKKDVKLSLRSFNRPMLELGRRETLGLYNSGTTGLFPDNDASSSVVYIRGEEGVSALEFQCDEGQFYKPIFFTDTFGNFKMRGSSAGTDFFELGSAGSDNDGSLDFVIGDDGQEPITFRKFNYTTEEYIEILRLQGTGLNETVRAGIGVEGNVPNSTLQVNGSVSRGITTISAADTLDDTHHTVILSSNTILGLPDASSAQGREYVIKKTAEGTSTITSYQDENNISRTAISKGTYTFVSDGGNWQLTHISAQNVYSGTFTILDGASGNQVIGGLPFKPSMIKFSAYSNVDTTTLDADNLVGNNNSGIENAFGSMSGFAQDYNGVVTEQVIYGGGSGNSINDISKYAAANECIGIRYSNQNGDNIGLTTASIVSFDDNGFTINVTSSDDRVVVMYTAYR